MKLNGSGKVIPLQVLFLQQQGNLAILKESKFCFSRNISDSFINLKRGEMKLNPGSNSLNYPSVELHIENADRFPPMQPVVTSGRRFNLTKLSSSKATKSGIYIASVPATTQKQPSVNTGFGLQILSLYQTTNDISFQTCADHVSIL